MLIDTRMPVISVSTPAVRLRKPQVPQGERAYAHDLAAYRGWCREGGVPDELPVDPALLPAYVASMTGSPEAATVDSTTRRLSYSTIERRLYGLSACSRERGFLYGDPKGKKIPLSRTKEFRGALDLLRASLSTGRIRKDALTLVGMEAMIIATYDHDNLFGIRARALLTLQRGAGLKPHQLINLHVGDVGFGKDGVHVRICDDPVLHANRRRRVAPYEQLELCDPGYNVRQWLRFSGISSGYLFRAIDASSQRTRSDTRLSIRHLSRIYKRYAEFAGLDARTVTGESPRLGLIVELMEQGADRDTIAARTGLTREGQNHLKALLTDVVRASEAELGRPTF